VWTVSSHHIQSVLTSLEMLSQSDALRFEEVFTKFSGKEFSNRIAIEEIEEALGEMKVKVTPEGIGPWIFIQHASIACVVCSFGLSELKGFLAGVDFEARDGLSVDQFISVRHCSHNRVRTYHIPAEPEQVVRSAQSIREDAADESDVLEAWISLGSYICFHVRCFCLLPLMFYQADLPTKREVSRLPSSVEFFLNSNSPSTSANLYAYRVRVHPVPSPLCQLISAGC
jgi:hypothetical protein